jgi:hypothetical protein
MKLWITAERMKTELNGFYDKSIGKNIANFYLQHEDALKDHLLNEHNINLRKEIEQMNPITLSQMSEITAKLHGF